MYLTGYDLSSYQGNLSQGVFQALKNDGYFAIIRVNEGTPNNQQVLNIDPDFITSRSEARNVSLFRLFYHFSYPKFNSAQSEASFFTNTFGTPQNGEGFALDFEQPLVDANGNPTQENVIWALDWLNQVTQTYNGTKPFIYMNLNLCNSLDWSAVVNAGYALWLADWTGNPNELGTAKNWHFIAMSQFTDKGTLPTGETPVDQDAFYGTPQEFEDYTYHEPVSTVSTPSQTVSTPTQTSIDKTTTPTTSATPSSTNTVAVDAADIQKLDILVSTLNTKVQTLLDEINSLRATNTDLTNENDSLNIQVTSLKSQILKLEKPIQSTPTIPPTFWQKIIDFFKGI